MNADGQPNGQGEMRYDNGHVYKGAWLNGNMNGYGTMVYSHSHGIYYQGEWRDGKREGHGMFRRGDGHIEVGQWNQNNMTNGQIFYPNRDVYDGEVRNGLRHGKGTLTHPNGTSVLGNWDSDTLTHIFAKNDGIGSRTRVSGPGPSPYEIGPSTERIDIISGAATRRPEAVITLSDGQSYNHAQANGLWTSLKSQHSRGEQPRNYYNTPLTPADVNSIIAFIKFSIGGGKKRRNVR